LARGVLLEAQGSEAAREEGMLEIRNILVPVDFSDHSAAALDLAISLARTLGARIHLLHCYAIPLGGVSPYGLVIPENLDREIRDAAAAKLSEWREKVAAEGIAVEDTVTPLFASEAIAARAEEIGADLVVMGTRGLTGMKHVLLGSVAERTIRLAPCPVLTVKKHSD
jgi:nucleotide-binding universal stress UspA family protein